MQDSSVQIMSFMIQDLLDYSQIKQGTLRKNITRFNIRECIEKVMNIQREKTIDKGIDFFPMFLNIAESESTATLGMKSPFINGDEERVM